MNFPTESDLNFVSGFATFRFFTFLRMVVWLLSVIFNISRFYSVITPLCGILTLLLNFFLTFFELLLLRCLRSLCSVCWSLLSSLFNTRSVQLTSDNSVSNTQVLYSSTSEEYHWVLLQVVTFTRDVCCNFKTVSKSNSGNLSNSWVRLLRSLCGHLGAYTSLEWGVVVDRLVLENVKASS